MEGVEMRAPFEHQILMGHIPWDTVMKILLIVQTVVDYFKSFEN